MMVEYIKLQGRTTRSSAHDGLKRRRHVADRSRSLWRNRNFLLLWSGQLISWIGTGVSHLAFPLLTLALSGSPAGVLVDRWDRRRVMLVCQAGRALSLLSIPLVFALSTPVSCNCTWSHWSMASSLSSSIWRKRPVCPVSSRLARAASHRHLLVLDHRRRAEPTGCRPHWPDLRARRRRLHPRGSARSPLAALAPPGIHLARGVLALRAAVAAFCRGIEPGDPWSGPDWTVAPSAHSWRGPGQLPALSDPR